MEASGPLQTKEFPEVGCNVKRPTHFQLNSDFTVWRHTWREKTK